MPRVSHDEPAERRARTGSGRAPFRITATPAASAEATLADLREWDWVARSLLSRGAVSSGTRAKLEDSRRIVGELAGVLEGSEPGEGTADERTIVTASVGGRVQAAAALFLTAGGVFVELVATAPWNLLASGDPPDARTVKGAGAAVLAFAERWSRASGRGGVVALQAENPRALAIYERLGFDRMRPSDAPLALVPRGDHGFSPSILRLAQGRAGPEEARSPWMVRDPSRARPAAAGHGAYAVAAPHSAP